jgi:hypothetical protein
MCVCGQNTELSSFVLQQVVHTVPTNRGLEHETINKLVKISLFHRAFQFTIYNGATNALVYIKTLIQMSHNKTFKITPTRFDHLMIETCWSDFKCFSL